ncbi:MAG: DUF2085 domain-containing protein [Anaerolineae bacterium]
MRKSFSPLITGLGIALALVGLAVLAFATPGGLLRKADYIGAAVCHRRASHSFFVAGRQLPLCQRCTGTFPGALTGLLVQWVLWRRRRSFRFPRWPFLIPLLVFAAAWGLDGINSTTADNPIHLVAQQFVERPSGVGILGYAPQPWLRLLTGTLMGMSMSIILVPAFNQATWSDSEDTATLQSWHELALLIAIELGMAGIIYLLEPMPGRLGLYAISLYSVLGVLTMLTLLGTMMFCLLLKRDGSFAGWREIVVPMVWGLVFAMSVVAFMDTARLWLTGTIDGVPGLE